MVSIGFTRIGEIEEGKVRKVLEEAERKGKPIVYKVKGVEIECASAIFSRREYVWNILGARNDEEAYAKLLADKREKLKIEDFKYEKKLNKLTDLPWIKFYEKDGGKYITSSIFVACRNGICNASFHRMMLIDERRAAVRLVPRHLYHMYTEALKENKELEVAIVISPPPLIELIASTSPPFGVFEFEIAQALLPTLRFSLTPLYKIPVPSDFSVVIEGRITKDKAKEGPFVDLLNTYDKVREEPIFEVDAIYKGTEPFHVILPGGVEHMYLMGYPKEASIWNGVRRVVPRVKKVRLTKGGGMWLHAVISIKKNHDGDAKNAIMAAFASHPSLKHVVIVDEDVDPDNYEDVEWAIATRFQADKDLVIVKNARGSTLDPSAREGMTAKMGVDATAPVKEREKFKKARDSVG